MQGQEISFTSQSDWVGELGRACEAVSTGKMQLAAWQAEWKKVLTFLEILGNNVHGQLHRLSEPSAAVLEAGRRVLNELQLGMLALESMQRYTRTRDLAMLARGWEKLTLMTVRIQEALAELASSLRPPVAKPSLRLAA